MHTNSLWWNRKMIFGTMPITAKFGNIGFTVFLGVGFNKGMLFQKYNSSRRGRDGRSTLEVQLK
ncbi:MAG: hypothetical protein IPQ02_18750 [Saprospiraceae bacterium]|nr:hypothetical protein [Candidatus Defluviibacterium haderslevense]